MKDSEGLSFTTYRIRHASSGAGHSNAAIVFRDYPRDSSRGIIPSQEQPLTRHAGGYIDLFHASFEIRSYPFIRVAEFDGLSRCL